MFDGGDQRDEAARAGLTVDEFREWSELNGTPLCGHVLPHGGVCRQVAGPAQLSPRATARRHPLKPKAQRKLNPRSDVDPGNRRRRLWTQRIMRI